MFARFTDRARQVVVLAQDEARRLGRAAIGTEHLLLGLLREEHGIAAQTLGELGLAADDVRARVLRVVDRGNERASAQMPFTASAKKVLELALREALAHGRELIGTEHVLLGLAREPGGVAAQILAELGVDPERLRALVAERVGDIPALAARRRRFGRRAPHPGSFGAGPHAGWEYRVERCDAVEAEWLNELGGDGWELVSLERRDGWAELIFKRRRGLPGSLRAAG